MCVSAYHGPWKTIGIRTVFFLQLEIPEFLGVSRLMEILNNCCCPGTLVTDPWEEGYIYLH